MHAYKWLAPSTLVIGLLMVAPVGVAAQDHANDDPSESTAPSGRVEVPDDGYAIVFPDGWEINVLGGEDGVSSLTAFAPSSGSFTFTENCRIDVGGYDTRSMDESLQTVLADESWAALGDALLQGPTGTVEDLPAGDALRVEYTLSAEPFGGEGAVEHVMYAFNDGRTLMALRCAAMERPVDGWSSIAATFEFLPSAAAWIEAATWVPGPAGLTTPEDAVREYLAGIASADFDRVLGAVAVDEMAEGYRFAQVIELLRGFPTQDLPAPAEYPFYADMNRLHFAERVMSQARNLVYSLLTDVDLEEATLPLDPAWAEDFISAVDPARLGSLAIVDVRIAEPGLLERDWTRQMFADHARRHGADERTERVALLSLDDDLYWVGFSLLRYGDEWKVQEQDASLALVSSLGIAQPTSLREFNELTSAD